MSRKEPRAQNDISIIIANLPKRLQLKIAEDSAQQLHNSNSSEDGGVEALQVEARGKRIDAHIVANDVNPSIKNEDPTAIPGLLRIKSKSMDTPTTPQRSPVARGKTHRPASQKQDVGLPIHRSPNHIHHHHNHQQHHHQQQQQQQQQLTVKTAQPSWFKDIDDKYADQLIPLFDKLIVMIHKNIILQYWENFCTVHKQLQQIFTHLVLNHLKFCCEQKIDTFFWKLLFYSIQEHLRKQDQTPLASTSLIWLLNNGLDFYLHLHAQLCDKYLTTPSHARDAENCQYSVHKFEFIAKVTAQKLLICLGDLNRYKSKHLQTNDYTEAFKCYQQAQSLIPTNGIPYNQLAIVSIQERKKFDAIYYHMRSLMSSNAIHSAKESLLGLFDDIRKKYEETEMKASPIHQNNNSSKSRNRTEVWIYPDGVRRLHRTHLNAKQTPLPEENRLNEMPTDDLLRRFISLYLYIIGKLYTGIGMETIQAHQQKLLMQLNALLKRNPLVFSRSRMLKMLALNIFVLYENIQKDYRREIRYQAFNFCNQVFGLLLRECNRLFSIYLENRDAIDKQSFNDLNIMLQYIRVYCEFLGQNVSMWEPLRSEEHAVIDCWAELASLFQLMQKTTAARDHAQAITEEDIFFAGFNPMAFTQVAVCKRCKSFMEPSTDIEQFKERIVQITAFEKVYASNCTLLETPEESFVLEDWQQTLQIAANNSQADDDDENYENIAINTIDKNHTAASDKTGTSLVANSLDTQLSHLNNLKKQLEAKTHVKKMYNAKLEQILSYVGTKLYIEVRPKYLLLDTNCLIDCLEDFEQLVQQYKRYILVIPLTVVKELDGLSKGVKLESFEKAMQKRIHHFDDVSSRAKKSLDFIKVAKNNVKCATTRGSIINASLFGLVEEEYVSNDDKILATALALSKTMSTCKETNGKCVIQTELVLITTDRNLRVKALSRNLAVSELSEFMQWAKNCNA